MSLSYPPIGGGFLLFVADSYDFLTTSTNEQLESDETDNVFALPFSIAGPDLTIPDASAPATGVSGGQIEVSWTVANVGAATAADHSYDNFYLSTDPLFDSSDVQIGSFSSPSTIDPGESYSPSTTLPLHQASPGPQFVLLVVDGSESLGETDETDNVLAVPINVALPNLIVSNITAPPTIASGNTVDIGWTVDNTSGHPAGTDWYDYVYLSRDELYGSDDQSLGSQYVGSLTPLFRAPFSGHLFRAHLFRADTFSGSFPGFFRPARHLHASPRALSLV